MKGRITVFVASVVVVAMAGCTTPGKRTGIGAGGGAAAGAAIGGASGGWKGAGIGALAGAAVGGAVGNYLDKQAKELSEVADTKRMRDGVLVNLKNDLIFDTGSANLKDEARGQLLELGQILSKYRQDRIRVSGFTDSVGSDAMNQQLSLRRANAVKEILASQGVDESQMIVEGYGEAKPVAENMSSYGRAKNRRVELYIDVPQDRQPAAQ